ncbi:MAG TPA: hypothetical protein VK993_11715 [Chthoniobacterales bacterium]|nr:hypothetical protein [Chthoniobacterales bacterium]
MKRLPDNGWSPYGLAESLRQHQKSDGETAAARAKFQHTCAKADLKITSFCLCQPAN